MNQRSVIMGASSVTGVGLGSADKRQKGSEHMRLGAEKVIGPRVVYAGNHTLDGSGDLTIKLPVLPGATANYIVMATDSHVTAATAVAAAIVINSTETTVTLKGTAGQTAYVMIVKAGLAI
jgi:hypothetical protein